MERLSPDAGYAPPDATEPDAPYGWFRGRRILGSGVPIDGGVYLGRKPREAIVVDTSRPELARVHADLVHRIHVAVEADTGPRLLAPGAVLGAMRRYLARNLLAEMRDLVAREMPYDDAVVRAIAAELRLQPDDRIHLDVYVRRHGGVCRHQVCLVGVLLELLVRDGWIAGRVALQRKHVPNWFSHAWVRFEDARGDIFVLDPAQGLYMRLDQLDDAGRQFYGGPLRAPDAA